MSSAVRQARAIEMYYLLGAEFGKVPPTDLVQQLLDECELAGSDPVDIVGRVVDGGPDFLKKQYGITDWPIARTRPVQKVARPTPKKLPRARSAKSESASPQAKFELAKEQVPSN